MWFCTKQSSLLHWLKPHAKEAFCGELFPAPSEVSEARLQLRGLDIGRVCRTCGEEKQGFPLTEQTKNSVSEEFPVLPVASETGNHKLASMSPQITKQPNTGIKHEPEVRTKKRLMHESITRCYSDHSNLPLLDVFYKQLDKDQRNHIYLCAGIAKDSQHLSPQQTNILTEILSQLRPKCRRLPSPTVTSDTRRPKGYTSSCNNQTGAGKKFRTKASSSPKPTPSMSTADKDTIKTHRRW